MNETKHYTLTTKNNATILTHVLFQQNTSITEKRYPCPDWGRRGRDLMEVGIKTTCVISTPVSTNNRTDCHDITEILLKVTLNTLTKTV